MCPLLTKTATSYTVLIFFSSSPDYLYIRIHTFTSTTIYAVRVHSCTSVMCVRVCVYTYLPRSPFYRRQIYFVQVYLSTVLVLPRALSLERAQTDGDSHRRGHRCRRRQRAGGKFYRRTGRRLPVFGDGAGRSRRRARIIYVRTRTPARR